MQLFVLFLNKFIIFHHDFQARKIGGELSAIDQSELDQTTKEQNNIQKQLEHFRRQQKQHQQLVQDYRIKQQVRKKKII